MILTGYFDESGTHAGSPVVIMAGIIGTVAQWGRFDIELVRLKKRFGFRVFHANEFKARSGQFAGWSPPRCLSLINELADLTANGLMHGAIVSVNNAEFEAHYRNGEGPRKLRLDTQYGLCFRLCLNQIVMEVFRRLAHRKNFDHVRLNAVLESGHRHAGDATRVFHEEMKGLQGYGSDLLAGMTFADKNKCDPLMVADFLAHTTFMQSGSGYAPPMSEEVLAIREKTTLMYHGFDPGGLAEYKAFLLQQWEARRRHPFSAAERGE